MYLSEVHIGHLEALIAVAQEQGAGSDAAAMLLAEVIQIGPDLIRTLRDQGTALTEARDAMRANGWHLLAASQPAPSGAALLAADAFDAAAAVVGPV